jgi:opacity protein-like surface antigen
MRSRAITATAVIFVTGSALARTSGTPGQSEIHAILLPFAAPQLPSFQTGGLGVVNTYGSVYAYDFGNGFKTQIEGLRLTGGTDRLAGLAAAGNLNATRITLKGMYEFSEGSWHITPFLGVGFGATDLSARILGVDAGDWNTAYQLSGGVAVGFTEKLMGDLEYRWTDGSNAKFSLAGIPAKLDIGHHDVVFGVNYKY